MHQFFLCSGQQLNDPSHNVQFHQRRNGELVEASLFYDSGVQVSMIRSACAEKLGLEGKPVKIVITKVGWAGEELDMKLYKLALCKVRGRFVPMIQAVGIPQILEETPGVNHYLTDDWYLSNDVSFSISFSRLF